MINIEKYLGFMDQQVIETTNKVSHQFLNNMWTNITEGNPVHSGLSKFSWKMTNSNPSTSKPMLPEGYDWKKDGKVFDDPPKPPVLRTGKHYKTYFMTNNQRYVTKLNDNDVSKYYFGFIDDGIRKAVLQTNINEANVTGVKLA